MKNYIDLSKCSEKFLVTIEVKDGMYSLTDLWRAAGSPENRDPRFWLRQQDTLLFIQSCVKILNVTENHLLAKSRGKNGGTYGVMQIALEYAQYLNPDLAVLVNQVFLQRIEEERNPELIGERYYEAYRRMGKDDVWIKHREKSIETRNHFTETLKYHGVTGAGYSNCTNAIYKNVMGGNAKMIRAQKRLPENVSLRDNMSKSELLAVELSESLASDAITEKNVKGNVACERMSDSASKSIAMGIRDFKKKLG